MDKPLLFISHKHDDRLIGERVAAFVRSITGGQVDVFLSSNPDFRGPRVGKSLNDELRQALWLAGVVILIYTSEDKDWSYCMWECGKADDANSPTTKVVVLQCLEDKPKVFQDGLYVQAWDEDSLLSFAYRFREDKFFPRANGPVTGLDKSELKNHASKLHADLRDVIPAVPTENWAAWPFLRLELSRKTIDGLTADEIDNGRNVLLKEARIVCYSAGLPGLFGRTEVATPSSFADLYKEWSARYPDRSSGWLDILAKQMLAGAKKRRPNIAEWSRFRAIDSDAEYVPGVGRIKSNSLIMQFDCYFYNVGKFPQVFTVMNPLEDIEYIELEAAKKMNLRELLTSRKWNRIPIFDEMKAKYIIHVSMIDRFVREKAYEGKPVEALTVEDLLADKKMENLFAKTFAFIADDKTVDDAHKAMTAIPGCEDVFVTRGGDPKERVEGLLTNKDITRLLAGRLVTR